MKQLKQCLSCEKEMEEYLLLMDNILEDVYRYVKDHQEEGSTENLIAHWITARKKESVIQEGERYGIRGSEKDMAREKD